MSVIRVSKDYRDCGISDSQGDVYISGTAVVNYHVDFAENLPIEQKQALVMTASAGGVSIPQHGDVHPHDSNYYVVSRSAFPDNSPVNWKVTITYEYQPDPLLLPIEIEFDTIEEMIPYNYDMFGKPYMTTAGELFDPPEERPWRDTIIRISRYEAAFLPSIAIAYEYGVNDANYSIIAPDIYGFPNEQVIPPYGIRLNKVRARQQIIRGVRYYFVNYEFQTRMLYVPNTGSTWADGDTDYTAGTFIGFRKPVLNQGLYCIKDGKYTRILESMLNDTILEEDDDKISSPARLKKDGTLITGKGVADAHFELFRDHKIIPDFGSKFVFSW